MRYPILFLLSLSLLNASCVRKKIANEYPSEVTELATGGGKGVPYLLGKDLRPAWKIDARSQYRTLLPFKLTDQNGNAFTQDDLKGKIAVVSFFFTKCPGVCPMMVKNLQALQKKFRNDDRFMLISLSVTPDKDTPEILKEYAAEHRILYKRWRLLTGDRESIYKLARESFGADTFTEKENLMIPLKPQDFLHSEGVYLVDKERKLRGIYEGLMTASLDDMGRDAETLLQ